VLRFSASSLLPPPQCIVLLRASSQLRDHVFTTRKEDAHFSPSIAAFPAENLRAHLPSPARPHTKSGRLVTGATRRSLWHLDSRPRFGESSAMRRAVLLAFLVLMPGPAKAKETHCDDVTVWQDWEERIANNPDDTALHTLHALWIGLCAKVTRHEFTTDQADEVFEYVRRSFIERRREYNAEKADKPKLSAALGTTHCVR